MSDRVKAGDELFLVAYPYLNVNEMLVVEELFKEAVLNTERKLIIFNGELDRIRSGYYTQSLLHLRRPSCPGWKLCITFIISRVAMEEHFSGAIQDPGRSSEEWGINIFVYISRILCLPSRKLPLRFFQQCEISGSSSDNLRSFVQDELATILSVDQLTQNLSRNLTAIRAVLQDAEEKQITSRAVKDWLQKLTDAAYVLDDILDECSIESAHSISVCLTSFHPRKILFHRDVGKRMKEIGERFDEIAEERSRFELHAGIIEKQPEEDEWHQTSSVITEPKVYGRDQDREKIVEFLLKDAGNSSDLSIYPIVGLGGLGKTTLAQLVFNDDRVSRHFDLKIWVCVSDDFTMKRILQSIIESTSGQNPNLSTLDSMQKKVQEVLQSKKYLLVLDDMWNEDQEKWEKLKYLLQCGSGTKGASILVTTRLDNVASVMGTCPAHHLLGLSEDDNWSLFKQHAFGPNGEERAELVSIGKEIVKKCAGSPLAAKALGSLLRLKRDQNQWLSVKESKFWDIAEDSSIMSALRLSYFNLKLSLRRCFSFCAIFPKDEEIKKEYLIHLWMANGLILSRGNLEVEDIGNDMWNELYQRSLFQEVKTDVFGNITFKMHDLVHDLAQSIMGEECVVSKASGFTDLSSRVHHVSRLDSRQPINMAAFKKVESLRTFLEFDPYPGIFCGLPSISSLRALRTSSFELSTLKNLTHLRYLDLYRSYITTLPESVCRLQKLQILKLERCYYLSCLPKHLTQLQDLRHIVIKDCKSLVAISPNIGKLKCLKTLSTFIVGSKTGFGLAELRLGGKLHIRGLENVPSEWDAKQANLIGKKDLKRLCLSCNSNANAEGKSTDAERVLEALQPHSNLKSFGMKGYEGVQLASWMRNTSVLRGLVDLILYNCKNCQGLPPLGKLPFLSTLFVSGMKDVKHLDDDSYDRTTEKAFTSLKRLTLRGLPNLERMLKDEGVEMLPLLSHLSISGVPKFTLPCLQSVVHLEAYGSNEKLLMSLSDYHGNEDVDSFPEGIVRNMHRLETLRMEDFHKMKVLPDELGSLSALEKLHIWDFRELESFPEHVLQGMISLRSLEIFFCPKLKSLSEGVGYLTCLENLVIVNCPELVALPSNMNQLTSLRKVRISGQHQNSILPQGLERIPSLQILDLSYFPCLASLPDWLGDMTSLQQLKIGDCPELRSLPSGFQNLTNLHKLHIQRCPKLEKRCKKGSGEDWQKIANVAQFELEPVDTFCEKITRAWKMRKQLIHEDRFYCTHEDEFNQMVDVF